MKRVNVHLPEPLLKKLKKVSKQKDIPYAELIRRAIEEYLEAQEKGKQTNAN